MARNNQNSARGRLYDSKITQHSVKGRLLVRIGLLFIIIWLAATLSTKFLVKAGTRNFLNQHAEHSANSWIHILSSQKIDNIAGIDNPTQLLLAWIDHQQVIQQGPLMLPQPVTNKTYIFEQDDTKWVISTKCHENICVAVGFRDLERLYAARRLVAFISIPLLLVLSITGVGVYYAIQSGLRPINQLAAVVSSSSIDKLETIHEENPMLELHPLVSAINRLIINLKNQIAKERKFLDTCAHELRTPVTALVTQIQSSDLKNNKCSPQLESIEASALRTVRVTNQLLSLAKNKDLHQLSKNNRSFNVCELARLIISDLISSNNRCHIQMHGDESIEVYADPLSIEIAIQNILDNAFRYGANGKTDDHKIIVSCRGEGKDFVVCVEDSGPGVNEADREKLLERFYRIPGGDTNGAGLGLSIVKEIVDNYSGTVSLGRSDTLGGLKISLVFKGIINKA